MKNIDLISYEENLNKFLRLNSFPVAIKFLKNLEEIPERTKRPLKDLKINLRLAKQLEWLGNTVG